MYSMYLSTHNTRLYKMAMLTERDAGLHLSEWLPTRPTSTFRAESPGARAPSQCSSSVPHVRASGTEQSTVSTQATPPDCHVVPDVTTRPHGTSILRGPLDPAHLA